MSVRSADGLRPVLATVVELLDGMTLDSTGQAHASIAVALALSLDKARGATTASALMAVPALARELRAVLAELAEGAPQVDGIDRIAEQRAKRRAGSATAKG